MPMPPPDPVHGYRGHVFEPTDDNTLPSYAVRRAVANGPDASRAQALIDFAAAETERHRVVKMCPICEAEGVERRLMADELVPHRLEHASARVREGVRYVMSRGPDQAREVMAVLAELESEGLL